MAIENSLKSTQGLPNSLELFENHSLNREKFSVFALEGDKALESLKTEWDQLYADCPNARLTSSWSWNSIWWHHMGALDRGNGRARLVVFACRDSASKLVGIMPCHFQTRPGKIGPESLYPLGLKLLIPLGILDHRDIYPLTEEETYLITGCNSHQIVWCLADKAMDFVRHNRLDGFMFEVDDSRSTEILSELGKLRRLGFAEFRKTYDGSHVRSLPTDWNVLRKSLSKKMKDKISYSPRFIERNGHIWSTETFRNGIEFDQALEQVFRLHGIRADQHKGKAHNNYFAHPHQAECLTALAKDLSEKGHALVATLKLDDEIIAAQLFFEHRKEIIVTYSGFHPDYHQYSPLFVLLCEVLKDAILRGIDQVNFLVSGEQYQTRWGTQPVSIRNRFIFVRRLPGPLLKFGAFIWARKRRRESGNS